MRISFVALALISISEMAIGQLKDVEGWQETKWGMSVSAVTEAYTGQVKSRPSSSKQYLSFVDLLEPVVIVENPFTVTFRFDAESKALDCVSLYPRTVRDGNYEVLIQGVLRLLTEKYGVPADRQEKVDRGMDERKYTWLYPSTVIELSYVGSRTLKGLDMLVVSYRKRDTLKNPF